MSIKSQIDQFSYPQHFEEATIDLHSLTESIRDSCDMSSVQLTFFLNKKWFKSQVGIEFATTSLENIIYRKIVQENEFVEIPDVLSHFSYRFIILKMDAPMIRYISAMPIFTRNKIVSGAITLVDEKRRTLSPGAIQRLREQSSVITEMLNL